MTANLKGWTRQYPNFLVANSPEIPGIGCFAPVIKHVARSTVLAWRKLQHRAVPNPPHARKKMKRSYRPYLGSHPTSVWLGKALAASLAMNCLASMNFHWLMIYGLETRDGDFPASCVGVKVICKHYAVFNGCFVRATYKPKVFPRKK